MMQITPHAPRTQASGDCSFFHVFDISKQKTSNYIYIYSDIYHNISYHTCMTYENVFPSITLNLTPARHMQDGILRKVHNNSTQPYS